MQKECEWRFNGGNHQMLRCQLGQGLYPLNRLHRHLGLELVCEYPSFSSHLYAPFRTISGTQFPLKPVVLKSGLTAFAPKKPGLISVLWTLLDAGFTFALVNLSACQAEARPRAGDL